MERKGLVEAYSEIGKLVYASTDGLLEIRAVELIGRGGTSLVYKGIRKSEDAEKQCIIKEFYPVSDGYYPEIAYVREKTGEKLKIIVKNSNLNDEEKEKIISKEKKRRHEIFEREYSMLNRMYFDGNGNSPYMDGVEKITESETMGDSLYLVLDTRKGKTLHSILKKESKFDLEKALDYTGKILEIIQTLLGNSFFHGDIKPENMFIRGNYPNEQMILLDFGSTFAYEDFSSHAEDDRSIILLADKIANTMGIGSSSIGYQSPIIKEFRGKKEKYLGVSSSSSYFKLKYGKELIQSMKKINVSSDIYSTLQVMYEMIFGKIYIRDGSFDRKKLAKSVGLEQIVVDYIIDMMEKCKEMNYTSVEMVKNDLEILKTLYRRGAHPKVLLDSLKKEFNHMVEIEPKLLADVELK